jgi:hypothetical protein
MCFIVTVPFHLIPRIQGLSNTILRTKPVTVDTLVLAECSIVSPGPKDYGLRILAYNALHLYLFRPLINLIEESTQNFRLESPGLINGSNLLPQLRNSLLLILIIQLVKFKFVVHNLDSSLRLGIFASIVILL